MPTHQLVTSFEGGNIIYPSLQQGIIDWIFLLSGNEIINEGTCWTWICNVLKIWFIKIFVRGGIKWIECETFYFYNIEGRVLVGQILDRGTSQENIVYLYIGIFSKLRNSTFLLTLYNYFFYRKPTSFNPSY